MQLPKNSDEIFRVPSKKEVVFKGGDLAAVASEVLERGAAFRFQAKGYSMWPCIINRDAVTLSAYYHRPIRIGEIIAFFGPGRGRLIVHRVLCKRGDKYLVKGDSLFWSDRLIVRDEIVGYVSYIERCGKRCTFGLNSGRVFVTVLSYLRVLYMARVTGYAIFCWLL